MKLLIAVVQNGLASMHAGPKTKGRQAELDEEAQFLELKLATDNPRAKENLEFWKKFVEEKNLYGLLVVVNHDTNSIEYCPLSTSKDYDDFIAGVAKVMSEKK